MNLLDFLGDIVIYISPDLVNDKNISHKTRKIISAIFIIVSLCYIGIFAFCTFWGIKKGSIVLSILGIIGILLYLYRTLKTAKEYKESQKKLDKETVMKFFDDFAPRWDNEPIADKKILNIILDNAEIDEGVNVLDVACGTGVLFPYYLERNVNSITAVDLSSEMVKISKSKFPQVNIICGDAEEIAFDSTFDCIMIYNAFPHFPNPQVLIENLSKCLCVGGRFTIAHGMSKQELDEVHKKSAGRVSNILPECEELAKMLKPYFNVDIMISNDKMYQVVGTKK